METPDAGSGDYEHLERPRAGNGKWRRSLETVDRDQRAAQLASKGWTYNEIAPLPPAALTLRDCPNPARTRGELAGRRTSVCLSDGLTLR